ncbi:HDIG domain-containing protein [bacterium]|nr:HDIG domain-containing protein [bacterium]
MKKFFSRFKSQKITIGLGTEITQDYRSLIARILLGLFVIAAFSALYLSLVSKSAGWIVYSLPNLKEGDISPRREIAPFDFVVPKPQKELEQEQLNAEYSTLPVFTFDRTVPQTVNEEIDSLFKAVEERVQRHTDSFVGNESQKMFGRIEYSYIDSLATIMRTSRSTVSRGIKVTIRKALDDVFELFIVPRREDVLALTDDQFTLEDGEKTTIMEVNDILGADEAGELVGKKLDDSFGNRLSQTNLRIIQTVANRLVRPNVWYNRDRSMEKRREARMAVTEFIVSYKKNERIIDANVQVTAQHLAALETLKKELSRRSFMENPREHYLIALGKIIIALGIIGIFVGYLFLYRRKIFFSFPRLLLLTLITVIPLSAAFYSAWSGILSGFLIPVAIASILTTILYDSELGIMVSIVVAFIAASMLPGSGFRIGVIYFLAGGVGAVTVGRVRHRKEFYRSMFFLPLTMAISIASTNDWLTHTSWNDVGYDMFIGAINGFFCPIIAIGILPLLESVFKVTTDITLLELSDLNNPLLKELAVKAPGTFSSVLVVGTLAEAAAEKIGANPLLARVGSYYHDIGKMIIPEYFIENQMGGENPHDRLSPNMSALVIVSHVKEGAELGEKHGLPEDILDIIRQHHGTSLMASIYQKAVEDAGNDKVDESAFRYPGPKPQTREAAIVMLADLVEAASRSVRERSPGRLKTLINTIIQKRFIEGELDECELTLKDLHDIEGSFLPILVGSHHGRIEYPWQINEKKNTGNGEKTTSAGMDLKEAGRN